MNEGLEVRCTGTTHVNPIVNGAQQLPIFNLIFLLRFLVLLSEVEASRKK
jgi:hypothetical protein